MDPKQSDQQVRGVVLLPSGSGVVRRIAVFCKGEKEAEARAAGADVVGAEDLVDKVSKGWLDFDVAVATPDMMREVGKLGKVLGPRGLMPNPKTGTVTVDVTKAIKEIKGGKIEFKVNAEGVLHTRIGKASFDGRKAGSQPARGDGRGGQGQAPHSQGHLPEERGRQSPPRASAPSSSPPVRRHQR